MMCRFIVITLLVGFSVPCLAQEPEKKIEPQFESIEETSPVVKKSKVEVEASAEYRVRNVHIDNIELSGTSVRDLFWTEQRGRAKTKVGLKGLGSINLELDVLDGVLFGDNGEFGASPSANSGVSLSAKKPNLTKWKIGLLPGGDPLDSDDYGPVLTEANVLEVNYLYADAILPFGLLRFGRQPLNYGATISAHDGGRRNRWGVSNFSDGVDRILFATKIDEVYHAIAKTDGHVADGSADRGVIWALFYDFMKQDSPSVFSDDLRQMGTSVQWKVDEADWFGLEWRNLQLSQSIVHLRNKEFDSAVFGTPFYFGVGIENVDIVLQYIHVDGFTEEISEGFAALASKDAERQRLVGNGAQAIVDVEFGPVTLTGEFDWASGDADPRSNTPITTFSFARDMNVGLLLFEQIIAFESARSTAVGIENLAGADVRSFPLTEAQTDGRFTNAVAAFPQVEVRILDGKTHKLSAQVGGLFAWSAAKGGVVDPILTSLGEDGSSIEDDAVNYHGGKPERYYGTEVDGAIRYKIGDVFTWVVEGAILFPGPALLDENGDAVRSTLLENRFELVF